MTVAAQTAMTRALQPGARIGRNLEVLRGLGEGGMGTLWVARNLATNAEVAIKVLHPRRNGDANEHATERFRHEARLGAMLAHRNVTRVFDLVEDDDGSLVLVMELLHGQTLEALCRTKGPISGEEAVAIIVPILGALQHAHDHGIVHRDIKPSNIFLHADPDGHPTPKLLDFGIAKMEGSSLETCDGHALGTPSYMSPEQVRASQQLDGRSDLFSVGSVLYEIITGENPFRGDTPTASLARVLELEVDPDSRIEPRLWLEIQRALSKQPYERHASAASFANTLSAAVGSAASTSALRDTPVRHGEEPMSGAGRTQPRPGVDVPVADVAEAGAAMPGRRSGALLAAYGVAILLVVGSALLISASGLLVSNRATTPSTSAASPQSLPGAIPAAASLTSASSSAPAADLLPEPDPAGRLASAAAPARSPPKYRTGGATPRPPASGQSVARTPGF